MYHDEPWDTPLNLLRTLCESCHDSRTKIDKQIIAAIRRIEDAHFTDVFGDPLHDEDCIALWLSAVVGLLEQTSVNIHASSSFELPLASRTHLIGMIHAAKVSIEETKNTFHRLLRIQKAGTDPYRSLNRTEEISQ